MNNVSKKYVRQRLAQILNDKLDQVHRDINNRVKRCSDREVMQRVLKGKVKLRKDVLEKMDPNPTKQECGSVYSLDTLFDTDTLRTKGGLIAAGEEYPKKKVELQRIFRKVEDELMLGDRKKAIEMLQELTDLKV